MAAVSMIVSEEIVRKLKAALSVEANGIQHRLVQRKVKVMGSLSTISMDTVSSRKAKDKAKDSEARH
eukprot:8662752-Pyramimonas_sp.AAC.1